MDALADRRENLAEALRSLQLAEELMDGEGEWLHGSLLEMIDAVRGLIRDTQDEAASLWEGEGE
jgi:hypothetical protein